MPSRGSVRFRPFLVLSVAVSCGYDTWFAVRLVMDYTASHFTWSILGFPATWSTFKGPFRGVPSH